MKKYIKPTARVIITESVILAGSQQLDVDTNIEVNEQYSKDSGIWHWMEDE